jgi:hypothetical protein
MSWWKLSGKPFGELSGQLSGGRSRQGSVQASVQGSGKLSGEASVRSSGEPSGEPSEKGSVQASAKPSGEFVMHGDSLWFVSEADRKAAPADICAKHFLRWLAERYPVEVWISSRDL